MIAVAQQAIKITAANVAIYQALHQELLVGLPTLVLMTKDYPVEITFRDVRFVFESEADIHRAIDLIASSLKSCAA